ncbi:MAG: acyl-CoA thioesterase [Methanosphaera stadtmanae]|nr:acyl-CoA thioesterase [Methanosphaera stadtmanae]
MFSINITPNIRDTDALRHININVIPYWFETARTELYTIFNPTHELTYKKWNLKLVHLDLNYIKNAYFGYDVEIRTYLIKLGKSSITLYQEVWQNGILRFTGKSVIIYYDYIKQENNTIPKNIRNKLIKHLTTFKEIEEKNKLEIKNSKKNNEKDFVESI